MKEHPTATKIVAVGAAVAMTGGTALVAAPQLGAALAAATVPTEAATASTATAAESAATSNTARVVSREVPKISEIMSRAANPLKGTKAIVEVPGKGAQQASAARQAAARLTSAGSKQLQASPSTRLQKAVEVIRQVLAVFLPPH